MKNMKVSKKLIVSFFIVIVLAIIVGIVGYIGIASLNQASQDVYDYNVIAISSMGDLRELFANERNDIRNIFLSLDDPEKVKSIIDNFKGYETIAADNFAQYELSITDSSKETAFFSAKEAYFGPFAEMKKNMFAFLEAGKIDEAYDVFMEGSTVIGPITDGFAKSTLQNDQWAFEANEANTVLYTRLTIILVIVLAAAIAISIFLAFYISGSISKPLVRVGSFLEKLAVTGDMTITQADSKVIEEYSEVRDEIGQCVKACASLIFRLLDVNENLSKVADGDLTIEMNVLSENDSMGLAVAKMVESLNNMFCELRTASDQVAAGAQQISQAAQGLASGSSEQAASVEEFSASLTELQEKTNQNAENSEKAHETNNKAAARLEAGIRSMGEMLEAMKAIDESSNSITKVIKVIDDIAFQTNILALNAAVEAARAGQHGKGFAVVADEVRNLASKSAAAAKETAALIEGSSERVKEGNQIVSKTNTDLEAVAEGARESTRLVTDVATASVEQAKSIKEVNAGVEQIATVVQANSATAEQSAAASEEMAAQAVVMNEIVARFKLKELGAERSSVLLEQQTLGEKPSSSGFVPGYEKY